jgi:hypothetical protein
MNLIFCHEVSETNYATERLLSRNPSTTHSVARNETRRDQTSLVERFELGVLRAVDFAHAAGAQGRDDFVRSEFVAGGKWHVLSQPSLADQELDCAWMTRHSYNDRTPRFAPPAGPADYSW